MGDARAEIEKLLYRCAELIDVGDFAERHVLVDHVGDVTRHLRTERLPGPRAGR